MEPTDYDMSLEKFVSFVGQVHLVGPTATGSEHTLCGVAVDAAESEDAPELRWEKTDSKTVTCYQCAAVVLRCRGVRVSSCL